MNLISRKAGAPPGSMVYVGPARQEPAHIERVSFDRNSLFTETIDPHSEPVERTGMINLVVFQGVHDVEAVRAVCEKMDIHPLIREDMVNTTQRPKLDFTGDYLFLTMKTCFHDPESREVVFEQVSFYLSGTTLVCFRQHRDDFLEKIKKRLENTKGRLRTSGVDYLLYALMDLFVDNYFIVLEELGIDQDNLQDEMIDHPEQKHLEKIFLMRRTVSAMRQIIWPLREILNLVQSREMPLVRPGTRLYFKDVQDHCLQIMDSLEMTREMNTTLHEVYLSLISYRMNTVMKVLTIIATIFIPLTFIAGVYGMNFEHMPELSWKTGYFFCLGFMATIGLGLAGFFKYKRWF